MGLDVYLYDGNENVEESSEKYPEHICNKSYLRSSYNSSGFNSVSGSIVGKDMYYIFQPIELEYDDEDEDANWYVSYPKEHLLNALERAKEVTNELKNAPNYRVSTVSCETFHGNNPDDTEAFEIFKNEMDNKKEANQSIFMNYSNAKGTFLLGEPLKVSSMIPGKDVLGRPAIHLFYEADLSFYIQQAEIIEEFIEKALTLKDPRIGWSG